MLWVISIVAAAVAIYAIIIFNSLVRTRQMANEAWSGIDVQLKRRSDLVPNLVDAVKGYAGHERSVLEEVTKLRGAARALPDNDVASRAQAETALSLALSKLVALAENYPDLKASQNFLELQQQLSRAGNRAADGAPLLQRHGTQSERAGAVIPQQCHRQLVRLFATAIF